MAVLAREGVVALEALLADHVVGARRRQTPWGLVHEYAYTPRRAALRAPRCAGWATYALPGRSISAASSSRSGGSGLMPSSGRERIASSACGQPPGPRPGRPAGAARPPGTGCAAIAPAGVPGPRPALRSPRRAGAHRRHRPREHRRVGLGVGKAQHLDQRLADHVVKGETGRVERVAAEQRPQRERRGVALVRAAGRARRRSARRRGAPPGSRPGWPAACRATPPRGRARSSPWRGAALVERGHHPRVGEHQPRAARVTAPRAVARRQAVEEVISAPERVVGIAPTRPPRTAAIAFAASITRPPPSATSVGSDRSMTPPPLGHRAARHLVDGGRVLGELQRRGASARGVVSSSKRSQPVGQDRGVSASAASRKTIVRSPSRQVNSCSLAPQSPGRDSNPQPARLQMRCSDQLSYPGASRASGRHRLASELVEQLPRARKQAPAAAVRGSGRPSRTLP